MSAEEQEAKALVPGLGRELAVRSNSLARRGSELIDQLNEELRRVQRIAVARRRLDEAWLCFATGVQDAKERGLFGYLIDAFDRGVAAAAAYLGIELPEHDSIVHASNALFDGVRLESSTETRRLFRMMMENVDHRTEYLMQSLKSNESELSLFINDMKAFLEEVARLIDPSMATTSFLNALERWDEISRQPW
jgi:hypothetical protein